MDMVVLTDILQSVAGDTGSDHINHRVREA